MATFQTVEHLASAFESGDASLTRWQKTVGHLRKLSDIGPLYAALQSEAHREVADVAGSVATCPICQGAGKAARPVPAAYLSTWPADTPFVTTCGNCRGSGFSDARWNQR